MTTCKKHNEKHCWICMNDFMATLMKHESKIKREKIE